MTAIARARSRGPRGRVAASPAIALSALRSLKFFFGALSAHFFEFVAEFLPIPRHPAGDLQHFRRPRTVVFSSCRGQMGERRGWKSRGAKKLSRQNCTSPLVFFFFSVSGSREKEGGARAPRSRRTESIATMSLWVDKHRPRCLDQLRVHSKPARQLQKLLAGGDCPHLLFYGPSGAGKKTLCLATLREVGDLYLHPPLRPPPTRALTLSILSSFAALRAVGGEASHGAEDLADPGGSPSPLPHLPPWTRSDNPPPPPPSSLSVSLRFASFRRGRSRSSSPR